MQRGFSSNREYIAPGEKLICALSYLTMGFVGFIWFIITFVIGRRPNYFVRYHIFQSVFISILLYLFNLVISILLGIIRIIPFIGDIVQNIVYYLAVFPIVLGVSVVQFGLIVLILYLTVTTLMGKYTQIPWVSEHIKKIA